MTGHAIRTAAFFFALLWAGAASAQDFRVETTVYDTSESAPKEIASSLTVFHAGKAYDFIHEMGELIVFEPSRDHFTLLSTRQRRATEVHVDEVLRKLQIAKHTLEEHLEGLRTSDKPGNKVLLEELVFQMDPRFKESLSQKNGESRLELKSPHFQYDVHCAAPPTPEHAEAYLNYADWICRLNYVLHPGRLLPEQRLVLNAALRRAKMIPVEVNLTGEVGDAIRLRARHRICWDLNDKDRELLRQWDALLGGNEIKRVKLQDYQRSLLVSQATRRR